MGTIHQSLYHFPLLNTEPLVSAISTNLTTAETMVLVKLTINVLMKLDTSLDKRHFTPANSTLKTFQSKNFSLKLRAVIPSLAYR